MFRVGSPTVWCQNKAIKNFTWSGVLTVSSLDTVQSRRRIMNVTFGKYQTICVLSRSRFSQYVNLTSVFSFPSGNQCSRKQLSDQQWSLDTRHRRLEKVGRSESRGLGACYNQLSGHGLAASFNTKLPRNRIWESSQNK